MDMQDKSKNVINVPDLDPTQIPLPPSRPQPSLLKSPVNSDSLKQFFQVTGGSTLYCISAVLIAYGIVKLLKPVLVGSESLRDALPCLLTLHGYELALLGVLLWIVFKKVVDDAVSLTVLIGLFLVGSSIALGSVADRGIKPAMYLGLAGLIIAFLKFVVLRRFARIPFTLISIVMITIVMAYNYFGPALMARSVASNTSDEDARRGLWLLLYLLMLAASLVIWLDAFRQKRSPDSRTPFLQSPAMVYLFALIVLFGSGVHQYMMAYAFTLERVLLDYVPAVAVGCLILIEVIRLSGKQDDLIDIGIACVPGFLTLLAIYNQSVLSSGKWGPELLSYPPVMLAGIGLAVAALAFFRKSKWLWAVVAAYGMGVIMTVGFSPEYPHQLNIFSCWVVLVTASIIYGLVRRNAFVCFAGLVVLCLGLPDVKNFPELVHGWQLTDIGALSGVLGLGTISLYLIFGRKLHPVLRIAAGLSLAVFIYDYLPAQVHVRYLIVLGAMVLLLAALWFRTKDIWVMLLITVPVFIRGYVLAKALANWRYIILGFAALITGGWVSTLKRSLKTETEAEEQGLHEPDQIQ